MIRNIFKKRKEIKKQVDELANESRMQASKLYLRLSQISNDERWYDTTYVIYSSEFSCFKPSSIESVICKICSELSYDLRVYPDGWVFYIYVKKREEPKYNVGDVVRLEKPAYVRDSAPEVMILGRVYDGNGRYKYLVPTTYELRLFEPARLEWSHLYNTEKVNNIGE